MRRRRPSVASARAILAQAQAVVAARAPEIERLRLDRPDLTADEAGDLYGRACERLGPRGYAAGVAGHAVPGSDPPYEEILAWIELVRPRAVEAATAPEQAAPTEPRGPGRPKGSTIIRSADEVREAYRRCQGRAGARPTREQVAEELGVAERTLAEYLSRRRVAWPPG